MAESIPLLPAPEPPLLLAAPVPAWKRHVKLLSAAILAAVLVIAFAIGWFVHHRASSSAKSSNREMESMTPITTVVAARRSPSLSELLLPGSLSPITEASLFARASGYVKHRYVDIGDIVRKGQVLADIDSPETDAQALQGQAELAQAQQQASQAAATIADDQARLDLAMVTVNRYETLLAQDSVARQDVDVQRQTLTSAIATIGAARAGAAAAAANVKAAQANVNRLVALQQFEKLRAPFDGVITARNVDEGSLISSAGANLTSSTSQGTSSSGGGSTSSTGSSTSATGGSESSSSGSGATAGSSAELFRIAQIDRLRVYVNVPQDNAGAVQIGAAASVLIQQFSGRFSGRVTRTSHAIDPMSRTLLTEVQIPNTDGALMPGMYAAVRLASQRSSPPLLVPGETLIARAQGTSVAILAPLTDDQRRKIAEANDRRCARQIEMRAVVVGRDYGTDIEILQGIGPTDVLVLDPSDSIREHAVVLPELQKKSQGDSAGAGGTRSGGSDRSQKPSGSGKEGEDQEQQRRKADQQTCIESQVQRSAATQPAASIADAERAPAGGASSADMDASSPTVGGPSDRQPGGIQSPSMSAPTQQATHGGGKGKK